MNIFEKPNLKNTFHFSGNPNSLFLFLIVNNTIAKKFKKNI